MGGQAVLKVFGIAGFKNAGKTTLVVDLIRELKSRDLRVATIKHAHHDFDIDQPGKDSHQHRSAGAAEVIVVSDRRWAQMRELEGQPEPALSELLKQLSPVDVVLVEGYKYGTHPKLELRRAGMISPELAGSDPAIKGIVSDYPIEGAAVPVLARADVAAIADFILASA